MTLQPIEQGTAVVQREPKGRVFSEQIEKRPVAPVMGLSENMLKIPHRLMIVDSKEQMDLFHHTLHIWRSKSSSGTVKVIYPFGG